MNNDAELASMELLKAWRAGDRAAGNRLCRAHEQVIRRFLALKVAPHAVSDLVQETWMTLMRIGEGRPPPRRGVRGYLLAIARWVLLHHYRDQRREQGRGFDPDVDSVVSLDPSLSRHLSAIRRVELLERAIQSLPLELQVVVEAHQLEGLRSREISLMLGIPEGTVRSRLWRARKELQARLDARAESREVHAP